MAAASIKIVKKRTKPFVRLPFLAKLDVDRRERSAGRWLS